MDGVEYIETKLELDPCPGGVPHNVVALIDAAGGSRAVEYKCGTGSRVR